MNDLKHGGGVETSHLDARLRLMRLADTHLRFANSNADVRGRRVLDSNKRKIGYVRSLLVDEVTPKVHFLEIAFGGVLGWGETSFFVPVEAIVRVEKNQIFIDQTYKFPPLAVGYHPKLRDALPGEALPFADLFGEPPFGRI